MKALIYFCDSYVKDKLQKELSDNWHFEVATAENELQLAQRAEENIYDLVMLPVEKGKVCSAFFRTGDNEPVILLIGVNERQSVQVYKNKCDGFVMVDDLVDDLRYCLRQCRLAVKKDCRITAVTFGRFDMFYDDKPINFRNSKAKELAAVCIDRMGGDVTMEEAIEKLWPDRIYDDRVKRLYRKAVTRLKEVFLQLGEDAVFISKRASCCIVRSMISCDYFRFMNNPEQYSKEYNGEYMFNYSWAEGTNATLSRIAESSLQLEK